MMPIASLEEQLAKIGSDVKRRFDAERRVLRIVSLNACF